MRPIKFRAWEQKENKMFYFTLEEIRKNLGFEYSLPKNLKPLWNDDFKCKFMQFTGLHDKNGKEIYEGDIVKVLGAFQDKDYSLFLIKWFKCGFIYNLISKNDLTGIGASDGSFVNKNSFNKKCEVIGNIFENKELMEKA